MSNDMPYLDATSVARSAAAQRQGPVRDKEAKLAAKLAEHGPREGAALAEYQQLVEECDDPGIRYLAELILADERRHHQQITEMLHQVQSYLWETDVEPQVPHLHKVRDPRLHEATERLIRLEREDAKELRSLLHDVKSQPDSSMLPLLVELMLHDTQKHIAMLQLIKSHVTT